MKEIESEINIIGGGLIGAATALSLSSLGYKITLLETNPKHNPKKKYYDQRTVAISEGTKNFLDGLGIWREIKQYAEPIKNIKVVDRKLSNLLEFDNNRRRSNLGYIVKNKDLINIFYKNIEKIKNISVLNNIKINDIQIENSKIKIYLKNKLISSLLNIAADGKNSLVRKIFKTPIFTKNYKSSALVTTFNHSIDHNKTAYEFFYQNGPLAILPMKKQNQKFTSSIVWTNNNDFLSELIKMENNKIISILNKNTLNCVGNINKIISKQIFPLSAHLNSKFYEKRTIYVGDSAHSFHPIAGQGWNLGMKDVESLFNIAKKNKSLGLEPGGNLFCKEYHNSSFYKAYRLYQLTDKLDNIFKIQNSIFYYGRSIGLNFIQKNKKIKNIISDFAMGIN